MLSKQIRLSLFLLLGLYKLSSSTSTSTSSLQSCMHMCTIPFTEQTKHCLFCFFWIKLYAWWHSSSIIILLYRLWNWPPFHKMTTNLAAITFDPQHPLDQGELHLTWWAACMQTTQSCFLKPKKKVSTNTVLTRPTQTKLQEDLTSGWFGWLVRHLGSYVLLCYIYL